MKLIYVPGDYAVGEVFALPDEVQHRLFRVMRMGMGDKVQVFDGAGTAAEVEIAAIAVGRASVEDPALAER